MGFEKKLLDFAETARSSLRGAVHGIVSCRGIFRDARCLAGNGVCDAGDVRGDRLEDGAAA